MGEAKRRGTFEQRQAEAIAAGRIKKSDDYRAPEPALTLTAILKHGFGFIQRRKDRKPAVAA